MPDCAARNELAPGRTDVALNQNFLHLNPITPKIKNRR